MLGVIAVMPLHFLSVEHLKLEKRYGRQKGIRICEILGLISGWGFFIFWMGIWVSPQPRFTIPIFHDLSVSLPVVDLSIPLLHLLIVAFTLVPGAFLGIEGVRETGLKAAETHRTKKIVTNGAYSIVRHPQYLGGLLAHVGISFLLSAWYSLISTPLMVLLIFLISNKEEEELTKEFGNEYENYKKKVPMLMPKAHSSDRQ